MKAKRSLTLQCEKISICFLLLFGELAFANSLHIESIDRTPTLDEFLELDSVPGDMTRVEGFVQNMPYDGEPATKDTIVFLAHTSQSLFVAFQAVDDPGAVRATLAPREAIMVDDRVNFTIDTFGDQRRAYMFEANPFGVQRDLTYVEGQGFDPNFDTVWQSDGQLTDWGYAVLIEVPFKSLRFDPETPREWRIMFERIMQANNFEVSNWPHLSNSIQGRLNQAQAVEPIRGVEPGRNLQLIPYVSTRSFDALTTDGEPRFISESFDTEAGIDIKHVWNDRVVTDLTVNPDFSQIESDEPQVTVNERFEVFFPERRPFFLENADLFKTPINLLFTRRIVDPGYGARVTAKLGDWSLASLIANDEAAGRFREDALADEDASFLSARVNRDIGTQSSVGAIMTRRSFDASNNTVVGIDGRNRWNDRWTSRWQLAGSNTRQLDGTESDGRGAYLIVDRQGRHLNYLGRIKHYSEDFDVQTGFIPRTGVTEMVHYMSLYDWPEDNDWLVRWGPEFEIEQVWSEDGDLLDQKFEASLEWEFPGQTYFELNVTDASIKLNPEDIPTLVAATKFDYSSIVVEYGSSQWRRFAINGTTSFGRRINFAPVGGQPPQSADWFQSVLSSSYRPSDQVTINLDLIHSNFDDRETGEPILDDLIGRVRVNWQLTPAMSLRAIVQHEDTDTNPQQTVLETRTNWNFDLLFTYRVNAWTAVYAGYNQNRQNLALEDIGGTNVLTRSSDLIRDSEQFVIKFTYFFRPSMF
jgi:hypothetical protein